MAVEFKRAVPILPVRSVPAALAHYRRLGFKGTAYAETWADDPEYGFLTWGPVSLHLTRVPTLDPKTSASACYLYVDDADALYATWQATAVEGRLTLPRDTAYGLREFAHIDPDGNLLRVGSPLSEVSA
jgi:catechol 2,3-dioxygenase-like lactoylglutathione lyase family enzyme